MSLTGHPNLYNKNMKKLITQVSAIVFAFAFVACSDGGAGDVEVPETDTADEESIDTEDGGEESTEE